MTRNYLKGEFIWVHQQKEEQIIKSVREELIKINEEIKKDLDEIEVEESENISN